MQGLFKNNSVASMSSSDKIKICIFYQWVFER